MIEIIGKKRDGLELSGAEISEWIEGCTSGQIPDYQTAALLMAICFQGLSQREILDLTMAMVRSGDTVDLSMVPGIKVDKHSTGGVGDTTTLVLIPLVAACGGVIAKMTGRGLGHTGGTVDKLESIPGFRTGLDRDEFIRIIGSIGVGITGQSADLTPADKKLYALRDVTGTVDQVGLIASSIMSKKIAAGADAIVLDVKVGSGAFLASYAQALELAEVMVKIGLGAGRRTVAVISDMSQPLGHAVGNAIEVVEAIEVLAGKRGGRLLELCLALGSQMLMLAHRAKSVDEARKQLLDAITSGAGLQKLRQLVAQQDGDPRWIDEPQRFAQSDYRYEIKSLRSGWVGRMDCRLIGRAAMLAGAGRQTKDDIIDLTVGLVMHKELGDRVQTGEPIATLHYNHLGCRETVEHLVQQAVEIMEQPQPVPPLLQAIVSEHGVQKL